MAPRAVWFPDLTNRLSWHPTRCSRCRRREVRSSFKSPRPGRRSRRALLRVDNVVRRIFAWWFVAERVWAQVALPKTDVAAGDRDVEAVLRASWLWSCGESFAAKVHAAWLDSRCRAW